MTEHQAIWFDHDGYIINRQAGNLVIYDRVAVEDNVINMRDFIEPTGEYNLPEGWPIYRLKQSIATIAINPEAL